MARRDTFTKVFLCLCACWYARNVSVFSAMNASTPAGVGKSSEAEACRLLDLAAEAAALSQAGLAAYKQKHTSTAQQRHEKRRNRSAPALRCARIAWVGRAAAIPRGGERIACFMMIAETSRAAIRPPPPATRQLSPAREVCLPHIHSSTLSQSPV